MQVQLIAQGGQKGFTLSAAIKAHTRVTAYDRLDVAVAYATLQGVKALMRILARNPAQSRWLIGLDDAVTQPEAIDHLMRTPGAEVRIAKLAPRRRFHPKVYRLWASGQPECSLLAIGSGNLTQNGLQDNAEAAVILRSQSEADSALAASTFEELWQLGHTPLADELVAYRQHYETAATSRAIVVAAGSAPADPMPQAPVEETIPIGLTSENVIATAVMRIAAGNPNSICSLDEGKRRIPQMIALTADDMSPSNSQNNAKWVQRLRNIQSNSISNYNY